MTDADAGVASGHRARRSGGNTRAERLAHGSALWHGAQSLPLPSLRSWRGPVLRRPARAPRIAGQDFASTLGWCVVAALVGAFVWVFSRYAVDFPVADDWSQILPVPYYFSAQPSAWKALQYLFSLSIEHRIVTLRLAALLQATLVGGLNFTALMAYATAALMASAALIVWTTPRPYRPWLAAIAAALLLSPINCEAQFWASGALAHFGVIAYAVGALFFICRPGTPSLLVGACLAAAAILTTANGLMICPATATMLWVQHRRRAAVGWLVIGVAAVAVYFIGYERPSHVASPSMLLLHPLALLRFYVAGVGSLAVTLGPALALGTLVCALWLWLVARHSRRIPPFLIGCAAFLALSYAAMTFGRAAFGDEGALLSRYRAYSETLLVVTIAALAQVVRQRTAVRVAGGVLPAAIAWFVVSWHTFVPVVAHASISYASSRAHYAATGHALFDHWPPQAFGDFVLDRARAAGYYQPAPAPALPVLRDAREKNIAATSSLLIERLVVEGRTVTIRGFTPPAHGVPSLWLDDGTQTLRVPLRWMPGVETPLGEGWEFCWGTVTLPQDGARRYRIGYGLDREAAKPVVFWSDQWVSAE